MLLVSERGLLKFMFSSRNEKRKGVMAETQPAGGYTKRTVRAIQLHYFLLRQVQNREFRKVVYCFIYTEDK